MRTPGASMPNDNARLFPPGHDSNLIFEQKFMFLSIDALFFVLFVL